MSKSVAVRIFCKLMKMGTQNLPVNVLTRNCKPEDNACAQFHEFITDFFETSRIYQIWYANVIYIYGDRFYMKSTGNWVL